MTACAPSAWSGMVLTAMLAAGAAMSALAPVQPANAQASAATKTFANEQYRYTVALPAGCRHEEGPGTIDAVCSGDLDPERSAQASIVTALVMEVGAQTVAEDAGRTIAELAQSYGEAAFRDELPEAVCGEAEKGRVKIDNVKQTAEPARLVYSADVTCAEVKFLQIGQRRASVRYLVAPEARYRLIARAPTDDFTKQKQTIEAFFDSFQMLPSGK
jgi:hypothetical protein